MNKQDFEQAFRLFKKSSVSDKKELLITFTKNLFATEGSMRLFILSKNSKINHDQISLPRNFNALSPPD